MKKDRFVAFFDAVMAIIMTIVVLEFVIPNGTEWSDLSVLAFQIIAYAVSFFWLGSLWINIHDLWQDVEEIDRKILWTNIVMLFFASMIPFFTVYFGRNVSAKIPALLYAADILMITVTNEISVELLARKNEKIRLQTKRFRISVIIDISIKSVGVIIGLTIFPTTILIAIILATVFTIVYRISKNKKTADKKPTAL